MNNPWGQYHYQPPPDQFSHFLKPHTVSESHRTSLERPRRSCKFHVMPGCWPFLQLITIIAMRQLEARNQTFGHIASFRNSESLHWSKPLEAPETATTLSQGGQASHALTDPCALTSIRARFNPLASCQIRISFWMMSLKWAHGHVTGVTSKEQEDLIRTKKKSKTVNRSQMNTNQHFDKSLSYLFWDIPSFWTVRTCSSY